MVLPKHRRTWLTWGSAQFGLVNLYIDLHRMDQSLTCIAGCDCLLRYLPQRNDGVLVVLRLNHDVRAFIDLSRAVRSQQHEFKPIWNLVDAVLNGYARHGMALLRKCNSAKVLSHYRAADSRRSATPPLVPTNSITLWTLLAIVYSFRLPQQAAT